MISKEDKQKIFNGAFAVSRDGRKCKFVGKTAHASLDDVSLNIFTYFNSDELVTGIHHVNDDLLFGITYESDYDVVGLWDDSIKPFNLERALAGEPVITREGNKAYVKYVMPDEHRGYAGMYPLNGYILNLDEPDGVEIYQWTKDGNAYIPSPNHKDDIIGMWKDPKPKTNMGTVTATLPRALTEPQDDMWESQQAVETKIGRSNRMQKFKKKPVVIQAWQNTPENRLKDIPKEIKALSFRTMPNDETVYVIDTLEGKMTANQGDWIIQGIHGELYPCKPDIFEKTYELCDE